MQAINVGRGGVLYDVRPPERRQCCSEGGRCLAHVTGVYQETTTAERYYKVEDGTHTTREWVHADDLGSLFAPAGWHCHPTKKPTYILTRRHGVEDHHDLMQSTEEWSETMNTRIELVRCTRGHTVKKANCKKVIDTMICPVCDCRVPMESE